MAPRPHSTVLFVSSAHPLAPWGPLSDADRSHWAAVEAAILSGDAPSMLAALSAYASTLPKEAAPRLTSFYGRALDSLIFADDPGCARALINLMVSEDCPHGRTWVRSGAPLAAQNGAEAVLIEMLARIGADFAQDTLTTMLQYCAQTGKRAGVRALLGCGTNPVPALRAVAQRCATEALEMLLSEAGPISQESLYLMLRDWNNPARTSSARTPLLLFAHGLQAHLVTGARQILEAGRFLPTAERWAVCGFRDDADLVTPETGEQLSRLAVALGVQGVCDQVEAILARNKAVASPRLAARGPRP